MNGFPSVDSNPQTFGCVSSALSTGPWLLASKINLKLKKIKLFFLCYSLSLRDVHGINRYNLS